MPVTPTQLPPVSPGNICHDPCVKVRDFAFPETDLRHWGHPDGHTAVSARRRLAQAAADPHFDSAASTTASDARSLAARADGPAVHPAVTSAKRRPPPPESDDDDNPGAPYSPSARRVFGSDVDDILSDISGVSDRPVDALRQPRNFPTHSLAASTSSPSPSTSPVAAAAADPPSSPSSASTSSAAVVSMLQPHATGATDRFTTDLLEDDEDNAGQADLSICPPWLGLALAATLPTRHEYRITRCTSAHRFSAVSEWELSMTPGDIILTVREATAQFAAQIAQFIDYQMRAYGQGWVVALRVAVTVRSPSTSASDQDCWEARLVDVGLVPAGFLRADPGS
ncbi:hypothetical protein HK405_006734 [Cladochytrium tenue]|nr:hypothetical protein HK405_006734 [Cladochytrium tenue]